MLVLSRVCNAHVRMALNVKDMIRRVVKLKARPVLTCFYGWLFFLGMYLLVGIFTVLGVSVETSFAVASLAGLLGFVCWVAAFIISLKQLLRGKNIGASIGGLIFSLVPLSFLAFGILMAVKHSV